MKRRNEKQMLCDKHFEVKRDDIKQNEQQQNFKPMTPLTRWLCKCNIGCELRRLFMSSFLVRKMFGFFFVAKNDYEIISFLFVITS